VVALLAAVVNVVTSETDTSRAATPSVSTATPSLDPTAPPTVVPSAAPSGDARSAASPPAPSDGLDVPLATFVLAIFSFIAGTIVPFAYRRFFSPRHVHPPRQ
jgi:hypothetical protein